MKQISTETGQTLKAKNLGKTLVGSSDLLRLETRTEQIPGTRPSNLERIRQAYTAHTHFSSTVRTTDSGVETTGRSEYMPTLRNPVKGKGVVMARGLGGGHAATL